jgi:tetratricopeptide (TPR) repeat protein
MPLAIELVAPQAASLPLLVITERIKKDLSVVAADRPDLPARQRSMVACFNFSYERLTDPAKLLFTRLSVFVGGANPITISEICEIEDWENSIVELVDKRLVRFEEQRYRMHPMVRRYGLEVLEKSGERKKYEQNFAGFFKNLIDVVYSQLNKEDAAKWIGVASLERENIFSGMMWYFGQNIWDKVIDYAYSLDDIFERAGFWTDRKEAIKLSVKAANAKDDKKGLGRLTHNLGIVEQQMGDYAEAERLYGQSLKIDEELGDKSGISRSLHQLGMIKQDTGDYAEAEKLYGQSLKINEELGDRSGIAGSLGQLGRLAEVRGDDEKALKNYLIASLMFQELKSPFAKAVEGWINRMKQSLGENRFQEIYRKIKSKLER